MRIGIIADVHANLEALSTILKLLKKEKVEKIFCVGDVVGYNANPGECIEVLAENEVLSISGNHDRFTSGDIDAVIRKETQYVIEFTRDILEPKQMDFVASLPEERYFHDIFLFVHGSPRHKDEYINSLQIARSNLQLLEKERPFAAVCFYGHTHLPYLIGKNRIETDIHRNTTFSLDRNYTYMINPGSVGQPRDQCPLAACAIFDMDKYTISFYREEYDIETTQKKIRQAGIDGKIADRLSKGR